MRAPAKRNESPDAVGLVVALLVRFPEIATIASHPQAGSIVVSFIVRRKLDRRAVRELREAVAEHVRVLLDVSGEGGRPPTVTCEADDGLTFVRVVRDAATFSRVELTMLTALFGQRYGEALVRSPGHEEAPDEDPAAADDLIDGAIDALRDRGRQKSLVGFREEKRVLVYFLKPRKKVKAAAR